MRACGQIFSKYAENKTSAWGKLQMKVNKKNVRIGSLILLAIGLFLPTISISFFGAYGYFSLFDVVIDIQSLPFPDDISYVNGTAYFILLVYVSSIITCILAILKDSESLTIISGYIVLIYSGLVILGVRVARYKLAYSSSDISSDPVTAAIEWGVADMVNTDIGVGVSFLISILLFATLLLKNDTDAYWRY